MDASMPAERKGAPGPRGAAGAAAVPVVDDHTAAAGALAAFFRADGLVT